MPEHTKGPWAYDNDMVGYEMPNRQYYARIYAVNPGPEYDFTVGFARDADTAQRAANAALLAAAPDLLEALEAILNDVEGYGLAHPEGGRFECDHNDIARAVIRRAKGGQ